MNVIAKELVINNFESRGWKGVQRAPSLETPFQGHRK